MQQSSNQNSEESQQRLNLQLITNEYFEYERRPEQYLLKIIQQDNPWPHVPLSKLLNFLQKISKLYNPVSYHNLTHAFDVMTSFDQYLIKYGWMEKLKITHHKRIFMLIAAYAHDSGHQGLTNAFYKNSGHQLAIGTVSPLQTMHAGNLKKLFREFQLEISKEILQQLVQMILKTDNFYHGWLIDKIQHLKSLKSEQLQTRQNSHMMNCILLHAADLNNAAKDFQLSIRWTNQLYIQFQKQAEIQQRSNLPLSFIKPSIRIEYINSNISFLDHMIVPLFRGISQIQGKCLEIFKKIMTNKQHWLSLRQTQQQKQKTKKE